MTALTDDIETAWPLLFFFGIISRRFRAHQISTPRLPFIPGYNHQRKSLLEMDVSSGAPSRGPSLSRISERERVRVEKWRIAPD